VTSVNLRGRRSTSNLGRTRVDVITVGTRWRVAAATKAPTARLTV
jgi:hypothetical protein